MCSMSTGLRSTIIAVVLLLMGVCGARTASCRVDYAGKVQTGEVAGSVTGPYDRRCIADLKAVRMRPPISMLRDCRDRADLVLDGKSSCCRFCGATRRPSVNPRQHSLRLR